MNVIVFFKIYSVFYAIYLLLLQGLAQTHTHRPPGPPAPAGCPADLAELSVQHQ